MDRTMYPLSESDVLSLCANCSAHLELSILQDVIGTGLRTVFEAKVADSFAVLKEMGR